MKLQSRMTVFAAIGGMLALMGGIVFYASLDDDSLRSIEIIGGGVEITSVDTVSERIRMKVVFDVRNPSELTLTIPQISYDLSSGGEDVVSGEYSTVDVAMPGRVVFTTGDVIPLTSTTYMVKGNTNADVYEAAASGALDGYVATGTVTVESAWSIIEKEFEVELEAR